MFMKGFTTKTDVRLCKRTMGPIPMELKFQQVYRSPRDTNEEI